MTQYRTLTNLNAQDKTLRGSDKWKWGLSSERKFRLEDRLRRSNKSPDVRGHRIGNLMEASKG